jgi:glycosyltransferase involved in cell wall biosynthesis
VIDALASESHYDQHLRPIWDALDPEIRGTFFTTRRARLEGDGPVMVASHRDLRQVRGNRPIVLVEHGAGQSYSVRIPGYPGGTHRERVRLFICPSEMVADANRRFYPDASYAVVGSPKMDPWHGGELLPHRETVAISFHWACQVSPEALGAWEHYHGALEDLSQEFGQVLGHGHPRVFGGFSPAYKAAGITPVADFDEVLSRASVYVVDNSSTGWEAMSVGVPVVWLNAPWYRRDVEHGLRFWEWSDSGVGVDEPSELVSRVAYALSDPCRDRAIQASDYVYTYRDGKAARRAAEAIERLM